ncbi:MAG: hypothetical protein NTZ65_04515 [Candidatus Berkelbacteria bacterium]|nr:hypothetical protein [Candidatus Berkelbacteria bacterium]
MKKKSATSKADKFYMSVIKGKTATEKLEMLNGFFAYAKKVNPKFFKCKNNPKPQQTS